MAGLDHRLDPFPWYKQMRATSPVSIDPNNGTANVFTYEGVKHVLGNPSVFSSEMAGLGDHPLASSIAFRDPPDHERLRVLIQRAFTPAAIQRLSSVITDVVDSIVSKAASEGTMDVAADFAQLPITVVATLLGVPAKDRDRLKLWSDSFMSAGQSRAGCPAGMVEYFLHLIEEHERTERDDLLGSLIATRNRSQRLSEREILGFCVLLLIAGIETTSNLITNTIWCLEEHPALMDVLRSEPSRTPDAIEEVLRFRSPARVVVRRAQRDAEISGHRVKTGQIVQLWIGSANRDEKQFSQPDDFDIYRAPNPHVAFGYGIHFCLGASLARLEARIVLQTMLDRFASIRRLTNMPLEPTETITFSLKHLPVTLERCG